MTLSLPPVYSVLAVQPLLDHVQRLYDLPGPLSGTLLRAWANDIYEVRHASGWNILKVYREQWRSPDVVTWEAELQIYLADCGVSVAPIVPLASGALTAVLDTEEGRRPITLSTYVEGIKPDHPLSAEFYTRFGRLAAMIHEVSAEFRSAYQGQVLDLAGLIDEPLAIIRPWFLDQPAAWDLLTSVGATARAKLNTLAEQGMDWGICQGDYSLDNVHVAPDGRLILHDFDHAAYSWRALDLYGVQLSKRADWNAFLAGYTSIRPLHEADLAAAPYIQATSYLRMMAGEIARWAARVGTLRVQGWIDNEIGALREWSELYM